MTHRELDELLMKAPVPERTEEYWHEFPATVRERLQTSTGEASAARRRASMVGSRRVWPWRMTWAAVVVVVMGVTWFMARMSSSNRPVDLQSLRTYYRETAALFPGQLESMIIERDGVELKLSDQPHRPASAAVFVRLCAPSAQCVSAITFSGQRLSLLGQEFEVLADGAGQVFLVAKDRVWRPGDKPERGGWRYESGWLEQSL